jgi:hypothetical protein
MYPVNPPVAIPGMGGTFNYVVHIRNNEPAPRTFHADINVTLPTGTVIPILTRNLTLPANGLLTRSLSQFVPAGAPVGTYSYNAYVGNFPAVRWDSSKFNFEKGWRESLDGFEGLGGLEGLEGLEDWIAEGWEEDAKEESSEFTIHHSSFIISASPNPFNSSTALRFELSDASSYELTVYDVTGREVWKLATRNSQLGTNKVVWDASGVVSGVYFARLTAGEFSQTQKLLLLK